MPRAIMRHNAETAYLHPHLEGPPQRIRRRTEQAQQRSAALLRRERMAVQGFAGSGRAHAALAALKQPGAGIVLQVADSLAGSGE